MSKNKKGKNKGGKNFKLCDRCGEPLQRQPCPECRGSGSRRFLLFFKRTCSTCQGKGQVWRCPNVMSHFRIGRPQLGGIDVGITGRTRPVPPLKAPVLVPIRKPVRLAGPPPPIRAVARIPAAPPPSPPMTPPIRKPIRLPAAPPASPPATPPIRGPIRIPAAPPASPPATPPVRPPVRPPVSPPAR